MVNETNREMYKNVTEKLIGSQIEIKMFEKLDKLQKDKTHTNFKRNHI